MENAKGVTSFSRFFIEAVSDKEWPACFERIAVGLNCKSFPDT